MCKSSVSSQPLCRPLQNWEAEVFPHLFWPVLPPSTSIPLPCRAQARRAKKALVSIFVVKSCFQKHASKTQLIPSILVPVTCRGEVWIQTSAGSLFFHLPGRPGLHQVRSPARNEHGVFCLKWEADSVEPLYLNKPAGCPLVISDVNLYGIVKLYLF